MGLVTLTTDFGPESAYAGTMKGVMLTINPRLTIVDLTHGIDRHQVFEAHYILRASYAYFPSGSVHVAVVDPGVGGKRKALAVMAEGHFFIAPDNGLLSFLFASGKAEKVIEVVNKKYILEPLGRTFAGRDLFAPAAAHLSLGVKIDDLGPPVSEPAVLKLPTPEIGSSSIEGEIIYIDHFGNLVTNIEEQMLNRLRGGLVIEVCGRVIRNISESYEEVPSGHAGAIINSWGHLEIFTPCARADLLLGLKLGEGVVVRKKN